MESVDFKEGTPVRKGELFGAELDEAQAIGSNLVSLVRLYKALGGGWPSAPEATAPAPAAAAR